MQAKLGLFCNYSRKKRGPKGYACSFGFISLTSRASAAPQPSPRPQHDNIIHSHIRSSASPDLSPRTDGWLVPQSLDVTDYLDPQHRDNRSSTAHDGPSPDQLPVSQLLPGPRVEDDPSPYLRRVDGLVPD
jgi:hypothetical protein